MKSIRASFCFLLLLGYVISTPLSNPGAASSIIQKSNQNSKISRDDSITKSQLIQFLVDDVSQNLQLLENLIQLEQSKENTDDFYEYKPYDNLPKKNSFNKRNSFNHKHSSAISSILSKIKNNG